MTATEASRSFATVLSEAEHGERIIVTRASRCIAVIGPAPVASGRALKALLARRSVSSDPDYERDVLAARELGNNTARCT